MNLKKELEFEKNKNINLKKRIFESENIIKEKQFNKWGKNKKSKCKGNK